VSSIYWQVHAASHVPSFCVDATCVQIVPGVRESQTADSSTLTPAAFSEIRM
jgi:hypothetical protein